MSGLPHYNDLLAHSVHTLVARANATNGTATGSPEAAKSPSFKLVGLSLAVASGLFIGVSFVLKKAGLLKANLKYNEEAGEGYGYLKNAMWWGGMILMILGEVCNFAAYLFADAILVTPLGALSVVVTAILSSFFLKERLSFVGKIGCFSCIVGAVVIAANSPSQPAVSTILEMRHLVISPGFLVYAGILIIGCAVVAIWVAPKYGKKTMLVYLTICSLMGSLSVVSIQGIGAAITAQARGIPQFNQWFLYVLLVFIVATLVTEIIYLNKALNLFNASLVTPTYYVYFTSSTIVSSAVLFRGFKGSPIQILTVVLGFLQICTGVVLLQLSKSAKDVPDTAVFAGDLDQMRTVAEQEEPEYEPRADTMRGTAALLRAMSTKRKKRETLEVARIREEHMQQIAENEQVEWDGLRRRRTMSSPGSPPLSRRKTIHPPLGMSHFPAADEEEEEHVDGVHPGFWSHFRRKPITGSSETTATGPHDPNDPASVPLDRLKAGGRPRGLSDESADSHASHGEAGSPPPISPSRRQHTFGLPYSLRRPRPDSSQSYLDDDTAYHGSGTVSHAPESGTEGPHPSVHWAASASAPQLAEQQRMGYNRNAAASATGLPRSPRDGPPAGQGARRQFSFQHVFHRPGRAASNASSTAPPASPGGSSAAAAAEPSMSGSGGGGITRGALSFARRRSEHRGDGAAGATEEERLGLVTGDSVSDLGRMGSHESRGRDPAPSGSRDRAAAVSPISGPDGGRGRDGERRDDRSPSVSPPGYDAGTVRRYPRRDGDDDDGAGGPSRESKELEAGRSQQGRAFI